MFRANRIGSPIINDQTVGATGITSGTVSTQAMVPGGTWTCNVINAVNAGEFTQTKALWSPPSGTAVPANNRIQIAQQITITPPISGDTVGLELCATICANLPNDANLAGFFMPLTAPVATLWGVGTAANMPTFFGNNDEQSGDGTEIWRQYYYKEQLILRGSAAEFGRTYTHGIVVRCNTAASIDSMSIQMSVRQLMDQQNISYRDTRR